MDVPTPTLAHVLEKEELCNSRCKSDITVPGGELVVKRQADPELHTAIQRAFDAARRRLQDYVRRQRGDVKAHAE
jgi:ribosome-associated translation inhibitor RaiA